MRYQYQAKIVRVIDADTFEAEIDLGFHTHRIERIRVLGYDAPEIKLYEGVTSDEKELGLKAKARAIELLEGKYFPIETFYDKTEKYGRFLANIEVAPFKDYAQLMISEGYVKPSH